MQSLDRGIIHQECILESGRIKRWIYNSEIINNRAVVYPWSQYIFGFDDTNFTQRYTNKQIENI